VLSRLLATAICTALAIGNDPQCAVAADPIASVYITKVERFMPANYCRMMGHIQSHSNHPVTFFYSFWTYHTRMALDLSVKTAVQYCNLAPETLVQVRVNSLWPRAGDAST
jgi:hypothetical protein